MPAKAKSVIIAAMIILFISLSSCSQNNNTDNGIIIANLISGQKYQTPPRAVSMEMNDENIILADFLWFCPLLHSFTEGEYPAEDFSILGTAVPISASVQGSRSITEGISEKKDVMLRFDYDRDTHTFSFIQYIIYELPDGRSRLTLTWGDDIADNAGTIHGEIFWAYCDETSGGGKDVKFGNAEFFSDSHLTGSVLLSARCSENEDAENEFSAAPESAEALKARAEEIMNGGDSDGIWFEEDFCFSIAYYDKGSGLMGFEGNLGDGKGYGKESAEEFISGMSRGSWKLEEYR